MEIELPIGSDFMTNYSLTIAYDGTALQNGTMDVKELAPALLSFGNLLEEANKELNGHDSKMQVLVRSDFKVGSFHVDFEIIRTLGQQISFLLNNVENVSIEGILKFIGFLADVGGVASIPLTVLGLFKLIKGRKIKRGTIIEDGNVKLEFEDNSEPIIVGKKVYKLFINLNIQESIQNIVKPLEKDGIDKFFSEKNGKVQKEIKKEEVPYYRIPQVSKEDLKEEKLVENISKAAFKIVTASFEEGYKWRLTNGQDKITATLKDEFFIHQIDNNEVSLSKEDILIVEMKTVQWQGQDGTIKVENEILKVLEHRKKPTQLIIPFYDEKE